MDFQPQTARFTDDIDLMSIARKDSSINYGFTGTLYNIISDKFYFTMRSKTYLRDMEKYRLKSKFIDQQIFNKLNSYNTVCITDIVINSKSHFIGNKNIIVQKNDIFTLNSTELYLDTQLKSSELFIGYVFLNKNTNYLLNQNSDKTIYNNYLKLETNHNINNKWSVYFTNIIKFSFDNILDFKQKRIGIGITYHIDCLNINLNMQQDGYKTLIDKTKPIKPISYSINFEIPKFNTL